MGALGLHGITVEEEYGGAGLGYLEHVVAMEEGDFKHALVDQIPYLRAFARSLCGDRERAENIVISRAHAREHFLRRIALQLRLRPHRRRRRSGRGCRHRRPHGLLTTSVCIYVRHKSCLSIDGHRLDA